MLVLRVGFGGLLAWHGLGKALAYSTILAATDPAKMFPDPLGLGVQNSLNGAIFGELVCGLLVAVGVFTRLASIPAIFTMIVAGFFTHWPGREMFLPAQGAREGALLFLIAFTAILFAGPGRFSADGMIQPPNPSRPD
jgi:putative oxidoreductase